LNNLTRECLTIPSISNQGITKYNLRNGLAEFLVFCPVYKIYHAPSTFTKSDRQQLRAIFDDAINENINHKHALEALRDTFLNEKADREAISDIDIFFRHCMQFTGPLMAKGVEDTAFYSYNPFIGHNEVGDSPCYFGLQTITYHRLMIDRQKKYPHTMNTTSSHDTKRGEDARARLNVLTNIPEKWMIATKIWRKLNREYKFFEGEKEIPTPNDEYFIYQVLCAHLPMDGKIDDLFLNRLQDYLVKALREAKVNSSWSTPDENYESKTLKFVLNIVSEESNFLENFLAFMREIIPYGIVNSITQTILKNTCPGIPDTYQGCEDWNLSFVDPDNRRRVNFKELSKQLKEMIGASKSDAFAFNRPPTLYCSYLLLLLLPCRIFST
jgi:maltooligosyltrehalose synthase